MGGGLLQRMPGAYSLSGVAAMKACGTCCGRGAGGEASMPWLYGTEHGAVAGEIVDVTGVICPSRRALVQAATNLHKLLRLSSLFRCMIIFLFFPVLIFHHVPFLQ